MIVYDGDEDDIGLYMMVMISSLKLPPCLLIDQVDPHRVLFRIEVVKGVIFIPANSLKVTSDRFF